MFEQNRTSHFGPSLTLFTMTLLWDYDTIIFIRQCWWCKPLGLFGDKKTPWHRHQADTRYQFIFPPLLSSEGGWWRGSSSWSDLEFWVDLGHSIPSLYSYVKKYKKNPFHCKDVNKMLPHSLFFCSTVRELILMTDTGGYGGYRRLH